MKAGIMPKMAFAILILTVGLVFLSGQMGQVSAGSYPYYNCYSYYWYGYYGYYYYGYPYYSCSNYGYYGYYYYGYDYYSPPASKYQLTVTTDPGDLGTANGGGTFTDGTSASFSVTKSVIQTSPNTRYVFSHWSGDYSGVGTSGSITMNGVKKIVAVYQLQYYLSVGVTPQAAPVPQGEGWYNAGDTVSLTVAGQMLGGQDSRLVFQGWNIDGKSTQGGVSLNLQMDAAHSVSASYKQQYYLKVLTDQGVAYGEGWYDAGTTAQIYVSTPVSTNYGVSIVFKGWQGDTQSGSQSASVVMDKAKTVIASWGTDPTVLNLTIALAIIAAFLIAGGILAYVALTHRRTLRPQYVKPLPQRTATTLPANTSSSTSSVPLKKKAAPPKKKPVTEETNPTGTSDETQT